ARPASGESDINAGFEFKRTTAAYAGTGVVTGLMDTGIDPNHINFTDAEGNSRVRAAYNYDKAVSATTAAAIRRFTTDNEEETHGTHVAGIMAGGYKGEGKYRHVATATATTATTVEGNIPFYGVATNSEIVMSGGTLSNENILKGVRAVITYAQKEQKPAVVNLSLGSNNGPHDGTGSLESAISQLGDQAIICIAAGNEGDEKMFIGKEFTADDTELKTFVANNNSSGIDIWTDSAEPITVTIAMYDPTRRKLVDVATTTEAGQSESSTGTEAGQEAFAKNIKGSFRMRSEVNRLNNRYHVEITGTFQTAQSGQNVALIITGAEGQRVWVYGYGNLYTSFTRNGVAGYEDGTTDGTISGLACGSNIVAVGSYNSRITWGTFAGYGRYSGYRVDAISPFSSFGTSYQ
ncbi:MAG: S8 family serine peptidase, partial [Muribaculaceae bacterium]|nr:S8 family serine peptidase [Muribaculaceae bacterium]